MAATKGVFGIYGAGSQHWVGDGFPVRNLFPSNGLEREVDPFLMLDYAGPAHFAPARRPRGVGEHPHRGFETVTIAYQGSVAHRDSAGNSGTIEPGDVQWMTAGSGVLHEEMHAQGLTEKGGMFEMVQLWVNLPRTAKMSPPRYQSIAKGAIPSLSLGAGGQARIVAGELRGLRGPAETHTPVNVFDLRLRAGDADTLAWPATHNAALTLLKGAVLLDGEERLAGEARIALLNGQPGRLSFAAEEDSTLLFLSGEPIGEPVASHGPFVMNTQEELAQAFADYRAGRMGRLR
jgi:redox-sensitive bicupin YhaK (pirin superfamily)